MTLSVRLADGSVLGTDLFLSEAVDKLNTLSVSDGSIVCLVESSGVVLASIGSA